jgi:hypothetical protein
MKTSLFIGIVIFLVLTSCEKTSYNADYDVLLKTESGFSFKYSDFELYDSSTHIFYFKNCHPEFKTASNDKFSILANGQIIYQGFFLAPYSSYIPSGPFIFSFYKFGPDHFFEIEAWFPDNLKDSRNDPRLIDALKQKGLLHSGLKVSIDSIKISGTQLVFKFTVTNSDLSDLMILDPDRAGVNLFHYFTNGLSMYDSAHNLIFKSNIEFSAPASFRDWSVDWLSVLKSGDSKQFTINYTPSTPIMPGEYHASFEFPGMYFQIPKDQLYQNSDRIWLGDIQVNKEITIN